MKSLSLQMQQNLILAATLIVGVVFAPQNIEKPLADIMGNYTQTARVESGFGTATSFSHRPEIVSENGSKGAVSGAGSTASGEIKSRSDSASQVPAAVQGEWHWISEDSSSRFRFDQNGRYTYVYTLFQSSRGRRIESTTIEEGKVSFHKDGTLVMRPDRGHFQGNTGDGYVNRAMDHEELGERRFHWELRGTAGVPQLLLGPSQKSAHIYTAASIA